MFLRELKEPKVVEATIGSYVAVKPVQSTKALFQEWFNSDPGFIGVPVEELHATILYSRKSIEVICDNTEYLAEPIRYEIFGKGADKNLVLVIKAPGLTAWHDELINRGGTHDFPKYTPHITLCKNFSEANIKDLKLPNFGLILGHEYSEDINLSK